MNDCLADDGLTAILVFYLPNFVAYDRHDIPSLWWIERLEVTGRITRRASSTACGALLKVKVADVIWSLPLGRS
jgi:hypothetical protein